MVSDLSVRLSLFRTLTWNELRNERVSGELDGGRRFGLAGKMIRRAFTWLTKTVLGLLDALFGEPENSPRNSEAIDRMMD